MHIPIHDIMSIVQLNYVANKLGRIKQNLLSRCLSIATSLSTVRFSEAWQSGPAFKQMWMPSCDKPSRGKDRLPGRPAYHRQRVHLSVDISSAATTGATQRCRGPWGTGGGRVGGGETGRGREGGGGGWGSLFACIFRHGHLPATTWSHHICVAFTAPEITRIHLASVKENTTDRCFSNGGTHNPRGTLKDYNGVLTKYESEYHFNRFMSIWILR